MTSQGACPVSDASKQPQKPANLTPTSESSGTRNGSQHTNSRKRKREASSMEDMLSDPFVVKPYPSTVHVKPRTLRPIALLPRVHVPLSCLDVRQCTTSLPESRLYESSIKILELESRMGTEPMLLLAQLDDGRSYYAVELESRGLYVLCKLGPWVDIDYLCSHAVLAVQIPRRIKKESVSDFTIPCPEATKSFITPESDKYTKKKRLAMDAFQSVIKRSSIEGRLSGQQAKESTQVAPAAFCESPLQDDGGHVVDDASGPQVTCGDMMEHIRTQYLEALYLSKTSLAYFAKGPLSKARAAFHLDLDSTLEMSDLIGFLDSLVLPATVLEKKYREGVPTSISNIDLDAGSPNDAQKDAVPKTRRTKKMKIGKTGLYPTEESLIHCWWNGCEAEDQTTLSGHSLDDITKKRLIQLRTRETQLQMILILEALALQTLTEPQASVRDVLPLSSTEQVQEIKQTQSKGKKARDLSGLADMHADRLCIWQSIAFDESNDSLTLDGNPHSQTTSVAVTRTHATDILREFCVEVIVPFYSPRLPDLCAALSRKLGGPAVVTSGRPKLSKSSSTPAKVCSRPGEVTKRSVPSRQPRSLQRALTNERHKRSESRGPSGAISLMRSATVPLGPGIKREASETPSLSSMPPVDSQTLHANRSGVLKSRKFSAREIDFTNLATGSDLKNKRARDAELEAELADVISAIRKPNRQLAGQAITDNTARRALGHVRARKATKPLRNPVHQGVQIMATPKTNRQRVMMTDSQVPNHEPQNKLGQLEMITPSSAPRIPQSVTRSLVSAGGGLFPSANRRPGSAHGWTAADATPSRSFLRSNIEAAGCVPQSSPLQARHSNSQQYVSAPVAFAHGLENVKTTNKYPAMETPRTRHEIPDCEAICPDSSMKPKHNGHRLDLFTIDDDDSFLKTLGWDDEDDLA